MKAMILAAGLGTRLRPYTEQCPKPLFPILGKPLILHQFDQLRQHGFDSFVVNAHHLREQFVTHLGSHKDVSLQLEDTILGTGGGLRKAGTVLGSEPVLVINGDILHTYNLTMIIENHRRSGCPISMVFHDFPRFNNVLVSNDLRVKGFRETSKLSDQQLLAFTGIHVIDPRVLLEIPEGAYCDIVDFYSSLISKGSAEISALKMEDGFWTDIGTPADYLNLHRDILTGSAPQHLHKMFSNAEGPQMIMPSAELGEEVTLEDWVFVGADVRVGDGAKIARSVIWDGAVIDDDAIVEDGIIVS